MAFHYKLSNNFHQYKNLYEKNPSSKVFVPLAECYRRYGLVDEALAILRKGLKKFKDHLPALVVLGHCYYDQGDPKKRHIKS